MRSGALSTQRIKIINEERPVNRPRPRQRRPATTIYDEDDDVAPLYDRHQQHLIVSLSPHTHTYKQAYAHLSEVDLAGGGGSGGGDWNKEKNDK